MLIFKILKQTAFRDDDGETGAGDKLLYLLERMEVTNTLVVVTRWYGGIQLGPDRFKHITGVAKQVPNASLLQLALHSL
jgi:putative IMPACT (imprinted ancient) family translation regulator